MAINTPAQDNYQCPKGEQVHTEMPQTQRLLPLGGFDPERAVKQAMRRALGASGMSREQACDAVNQAADDMGFKLAEGNGRRLKQSTFDKWLNPAERERVPSLKAILAFCRALGTVEPLAALAEGMGLRVINQEQAKLLRAAEIDAEIAKLQREKRKLKS